MSLRVIDGGDGEDEAPVTRRLHPVFCDHGRFQLDSESRRVFCGRCEQELDPFTVLLKLAGQFERINGRFKRACAEAVRAEARLKDLKRLERNAKARVRRTPT